MLHMLYDDFLAKCVVILEVKAWWVVKLQEYYGGEHTYMLDFVWKSITSFKLWSSMLFNCDNKV